MDSGDTTRKELRCPTKRLGRDELLIMVLLENQASSLRKNMTTIARTGAFDDNGS